MPLRLHEQAAVHLISTNSRRGPARHLPVKCTKAKADARANYETQMREPVRARNLT
jgi:hypothetical protein